MDRSFPCKHISILGSTGSIGRNVLEIAAMFPERFVIEALAAKNNIDILAGQIRQFRPKLVSLFDESSADRLQKQLPKDISVQILFGDEGYKAVATHHAVDIVVSSMVGAAGLFPTLAAIRSGKDIALANKETLVMAGEIVMQEARKYKVRILPVDSEHSAVFQCIAGQRPSEIAKILLTASGGPFLNRPGHTFDTIRLADALNHPNWDMGKKITIDSATLMNKGLEVIEAKHLFAISEDRIEVVVHPQSIIHSMVSFHDGSVLAQLGIPDMKGAIAYALSWPERLALKQPVPDFAAIGSLHFQRPDLEKFPCLTYAYEACRKGGTLPAVLNAANEIAVQAFLDSRLPFIRIPDVIRRTMDSHQIDKQPKLSDIKNADQWARLQAGEFINRIESSGKS
ncbi:MAG: 1-deoxy-D-xylulose-5-phosphate reductoisomerase [Pseudomonadota bacterium]